MRFGFMQGSSYEWCHAEVLDCSATKLQVHGTTQTPQRPRTCQPSSSRVPQQTSKHMRTLLPLLHCVGAVRCQFSSFVIELRDKPKVPQERICPIIAAQHLVFTYMRSALIWGQSGTKLRTRGHRVGCSRWAGACVVCLQVTL